MKKKISVLVAGTAVGILAAVGSAGPASAAHCVAPASEPSAPGFSYFGTDHVKSSVHDSEGRGKHNGTSGASNCRDTTGSPSDRAPGQN